LSQKLSKSYRIRHKKDFDDLRKVSKKLTIRPLVFYYSTETNLSNARIAFSISSKNFNAVKRNKIKRTLRECFRKNEIFKKLPIDVMVVVISKNEVAEYLESMNKFFKRMLNE
jgi:ribonuclease P protein component